MTDTSTLKTDPTLIESILERGFDPAMPAHHADFLRLVADAEAIDAAGIHHLPPAFSGMGRQYGETGDALTLPVAVGHGWLAQLLGTSTVTLEETALTDAIGTLIRRLVPVLQQFVRFEAVVSRSARVLHNDVDPAPVARETFLDNWLRRWQMFPVLASLITLTLANWIRAMEEMIRALEHDHADIATSLATTSSPLNIRAIYGDAGDPHLGGRSVMILTFGDDARVLFKPKHLAITDVFRHLVDRVNAAGFSTQLRVQRAIVRDGHTWEEYVPHRSCNSQAQVERFYRRMGGWIRLLQVLEGRDFWLDNLVADGEYPVFIDLETIMQPRRLGADLPAADKLVQDRIESSPLVTNIVAMPVPIGPGLNGEDLGCFATPKEFLSPFPATEITGVTNTGSSRDGYRTWTHPEHAPKVGEHPVAADKWFPAIEAGYREMAKSIDLLADELLEPGGLVDQLSMHPVRTIFRDTWTCIRIIHRSTAPPLLGSYQRRRQFLERMDRNADHTSASTGPVIAAEVRAMSALDVPFFSAIGNEDAIHPPDASPVPGFFDGTARERVIANLRCQPPGQLEEDIALLRTSFWTAHPDSPVLNADEKRHPTTTHYVMGFDDAANHIVDSIAATRTVADDVTSSWTALSYHPSVDIDTWTPIGNDLLSGRAGLVPVFVDQWHSSREDRWYNLAVETAAAIANTVRQVTRPLMASSSSDDWHHPDSPVMLGAFNGIGGMLASVKLAYESTGVPELDHTWRSTLDGIDWETALNAATHDVIEGSIGLGLALTARPGWIDELPRNLRESLASIALRDELEPFVARPESTKSKLAAIPGETIGRLVIRSRLGEEPGTPIRESILDVLKSGPTTGDLVGILEFSTPHESWWTALTEATNSAIDTHSKSTLRARQIAAAELALAMWCSSLDEKWRDQARTIGNALITDYMETGSWFPDDLAEDRFRLSAVFGLPAIASMLRRVDGASALTSPMTLDWRSWPPR